MVHSEIDKFWNKFESIYTRGINLQTIKINGININFKDFYDYIAAIDYKFECCKTYLDKIINQYDLDLMEVQRNPTKLLDLTMSTEFISWIDCFLFQTKSCLDIIAHIINLVYEINLPLNKVNIFSIIDNFPDRSNPFYLKLKRHRSDWIDQFNKYRKFITHHKLLTTGSKLSGKRGGIIKLIPHTLPDNPFVYPRTFKLKINLKDFFSNCHKNTLKLILLLYDEMEMLL